MTFISNPPIAMTRVENRRVRLEKLLQLAAREYHLRFEFGEREMLDKGHIVMAGNTYQVASAQYNYLKGRALHLMGHYLSNSQAEYELACQEEQQNKPHFLSLWHAIEDARIENQILRHWPGAGRSFEATLLPKLGGFFLRMMPDVEQLVWGLYLEGRGYPGAKYRSRIRDALNGIREEILMGANGATARASLSAVRSIYPYLTKLIRISKRGSPPSSVGEHRTDSTEPKRSEDERLKSSNDDPSGLTPEIETSNDLVSVGVKGRREEFPEWYRPGSMPWFERGIGSKQIHPSVVQTSLQTVIVPPSMDFVIYQQLYGEVQREVGFISQRLTNTIREKVYLRYGGYYRSGKLNMAKLWKQRTGNYRLFQRPVAGGRREVAISLLVDESASMKGQEKYKISQKTTLILGEAFDFLCIPLEIIGFSTNEFEARAAMKLGLVPAYQYRTMRCSRLEHRIYKQFDEPYRMIRTRLVGIEPRHNNWDEEHLLFAFQRIQSRPESNKLMIVICDGQPNGDANRLIQAVRRVESLGVRTIGIGIGSDFIKEIYPQAIVVADLPQMVEELLHILEPVFQVGNVL